MKSLIYIEEENVVKSYSTTHIGSTVRCHWLTDDDDDDSNGINYALLYAKNKSSRIVRTWNRAVPIEPRYLGASLLNTDTYSLHVGDLIEV